MKEYSEWYDLIKVKFPGNAELNEILVKSVTSANQKDGYFDKPGGGNRGGRGGGRGGGKRY
jgi:hypothetical protein